MIIITRRRTANNSYSSIGFCLSEVPVCKLFQETKCYRMDANDLKVYQECHKILKDVNEAIVQGSHDTGACYGKLFSKGER